MTENDEMTLVHRYGARTGATMLVLATAAALLGNALGL